MPPKKPARPILGKKPAFAEELLERKKREQQITGSTTIERHSAGGKSITLEASNGAGHFKFFVRVYSGGEFKKTFGCYTIDQARQRLASLGVVKK